MLLSSIEPSLINLDHRRHRIDRTVDQRQTGFWIYLFPCIKLPAQIAQERHALRFARAALLQHRGPLLLHIVGQITISRDRLPDLYQSRNDLLT